MAFPAPQTVSRCVVPIHRIYSLSAQHVRPLACVYRRITRLLGKAAPIKLGRHRIVQTFALLVTVSGTEDECFEI